MCSNLGTNGKLPSVESLSAVLLLVLVDHDTHNYTHYYAQYHLKREQGENYTKKIGNTKRPMKNFLMPDIAAGAGSSWCFLGASATVA